MLTEINGRDAPQVITVGRSCLLSAYMPDMKPLVSCAAELAEYNNDFDDTLFALRCESIERHDGFL